ncbi:metallophosphoesterase family protein [Sphingobacterium rhinopitheci]|uniref:metallophosphoesterase family protein n=1 Tax=Sphingobacterium rhinopitheci TaxID=2781960 RepID=UPI001F51E56E|nr:metallophosphoesterase [Sphingobacterium rhinopitheci]MCI0921199.1 metallophosphoesterase [Sphingobacterium rhinopitheci]
MNLPKKLLLIICVFTIVAVSKAQDFHKESKNRNLKILLISDLNDSYGAVTYSKELHDVVSRVKDIKPDIILCGGDMVAGQKASLTKGRLDSMWTAFDRAVLDPIYQLGVPFGFTMGNHDASPSFLLDRESASSFWSTHKHKANLTYVDDTHFPYYFSYIKNNVFFISWDASSAYIPEAVKEWMQQQLVLPVAKEARARIVLGHLPLYAIVASKNKKGEVIEEADETLDFLKANKVDMYISGHQHVYYPATKEQLTLLNAGCLGGGPRELMGHSGAASKAYAILELPKRKTIESIKITGYEPANHRPILMESLPDSVSGMNGTIYKLK